GLDQRGDVAGHVRDRVAAVRQPGREANVTAVEANHAEAAAGQLNAEPGSPAHQLRAQPCDEDDGRVGWVAESLIRKLDPASLRQRGSHGKRYQSSLA